MRSHLNKNRAIKTPLVFFFNDFHTPSSTGLLEATLHLEICRAQITNMEQ